MRHAYILSFNRPDCLRATLDSMREQTEPGWRVTLVQDGPRWDHREQDMRNIDRCISLFAERFPGAPIHQHADNKGIGMSVLGAQRHAFAESGLEVAYFFEDDLVLHERYFEQLAILEALFRLHRHQVPIFAAYGTLHTLRLPPLVHVGDDLRFMEHLWGYGLFREHWQQEQHLLAPYYDHLADVPYRERNHALIREIFADLGCPHEVTSQDGAQIVALRVLGRCALTTRPTLARYIGETGAHATPEFYRAWGFSEVQPAADAAPAHPAISEGLLTAACRQFPQWVEAMKNLPPTRIVMLEQEVKRATAALEQSRPAMERKNEELSAALKALERKQLTLEQTKSALEEARAELARAHDETEGLRSRVQALQESTSWKITAPMRRIMDGLGLARGRVRFRRGPGLRPARGIVALDISTIWNHDAGTGIQRVVRNIARLLGGRELDGRRIVLVDYSSGIPRDVTAGFLDGRRRAVERAAVTEVEMMVMLDSSFGLATALAGDLKRARHSGVHVVSICHDLLPVRHPHWFEVPNRRAHQEWLAAAIEFSSAILCISAATMADLQEHLETHGDPATRPALAHWPLGCDLGQHTGSKRQLAASLPGPYALMVGTVEPRKGHDFVLGAMQELRAAGKLDHALVVVGRYGWKAGSTSDRLRQAEEEGWVAWLDEGVSDSELAGIYESASCVIQASRGEGFGLPVAEAAHFRKPVVLSDIPVFREIVASDGYFFRTDDRAAFASALERALAPAAPPTQATAVSWRESAEIFWEQCRRLLR